MKCDFCKRDNAVGVFSTHVPISLAYCQECLDVNEIRTRHNVHHNWLRVDDYLKSGYTVYFNGEYLTVKEYCNKITHDDVDEMYTDEWGKFKTLLKEKITERDNVKKTGS